ncbi:MAG: terminase gpA endonuclease subunit [Armatimonadota bacterium]|nr:phage terminase large subunit family protein [bacterium]
MPKAQKASSRKISLKWSDWLMEALRGLKPPESLTVSEWADKHRILDSRTSAIDGPFRTWRTEYLRGVMDAFTDPEVEELWLCKPAQCGGTEAEYNILGYIIDQDPGPTMIVYPDEKFAKRMSKTRIQPMIQACPTLRAKYIESESEDLELHFTDMVLILAWAGSPAAVAGAPCRYVFLDEVGKFPSRAGKEANSIALAYDRTKTFESSRKIIGTSTPVLESDQFYRRRKMADQVLRYYVPCPHCGCEQVMKFSGGVKWPHGCDPSEAYDLSYYECESCSGKINEAHKSVMVRNGRWRAIDRDKGGLAAGLAAAGGSSKPVAPFEFAPGCRRAIWLEMSSLISPFVRIGEMARAFLRCKDYPEELQDFINSALGEPWRNTVVDLPSDVVMNRQTEYPQGVVPPEAMLLTGGVDVQQDCVYWTVRAWGPLLTSWNVAHGQCLSLWDLEPIMNRTWRKPNGEEFLVSLAAIDSGDQTDDVYDFCALNPDWAVPVKGNPATMQTFFKIAIIDKVGSKAQGTRLVHVNGAAYKTMITTRMQRENGRGSWMVHADCDLDYANQVTAEKQEVLEVNGREVKTWKKKSSHAANHYLDAEVYCACAADLMQVRYLDTETPET